MINPYVRILEHMKIQGTKNNPSSIQIGIVITSNPLTIKVGDLPINGNNLLIADYLLKNYKREISISTTNATGIAGDQNISSIAIPDATLNFINGLNKDDSLALLPTQDNQTYIVLARVVNI